MTLRAPLKTSVYRGSVLVTGPAVEPVAAMELQDHLRADGSMLSIAEANGLIEEARQEIEDISGLALINQTWRLSLDNWPNAQEQWWNGTVETSISQLYGPRGIVGTIALPRYPVASITSMTIYDEASNPTSVNVGAVFDVDTYQRPARIRLKSGQTWPIALRPTNAIEIDYVAGYGANGDAVPASIKRSIKLMAGYMFSHRGDGCDMNEAFQESGAAGIVGKYKVKRL
jgi:hypothetical protein